MVPLAEAVARILSRRLHELVLGVQYVDVLQMLARLLQQT